MSRISSLRRRGLALVPILAAFVIAAPVAAGQPADQQLNPEPPDFYTCTTTGGGTICRALTSDDYGPDATGIFCGGVELLDQGTRTVKATRWYDADGNLVRRQRINDFDDTRITNPSTGESVYYQQHNTDWETFTVPGDPSSAVWSGHGVLALTIPGSGIVILGSGVAVVDPDGTLLHRGGKDRLLVDTLCAALAD